VLKEGEANEVERKGKKKVHLSHTVRLPKHMHELLCCQKVVHKLYIFEISIIASVLYGLIYMGY
jgi:hypothetical protein